MPMIMPFGKYGKKAKEDKALSVEQIALKDYNYFDYIKNKVSYVKLKERFDFVDYVVNNFISEKSCTKCQEPARLISIWHSSYGPDNHGKESLSRSSHIHFIYCSKEHFNTDSKVGEKAQILPLTFNSALSSTKKDTNALVKIIAECMGLNPKNKYSQEALEDFFNNVKTYK